MSAHLQGPKLRLSPRTGFPHYLRLVAYMKLKSSFNRKIFFLLCSKGPISSMDVFLTQPRTLQALLKISAYNMSALVGSSVGTGTFPPIQPALAVPSRAAQVPARQVSGGQQTCMDQVPIHGRGGTAGRGDSERLPAVAGCPAGPQGATSKDGRRGVWGWALPLSGCWGAAQSRPGIQLEI